MNNNDINDTPQHPGETQRFYESVNPTPGIPADHRIANVLSLVELAFEALALGQDVGELLAGIKKQLDALGNNPSNYGTI